MKTRIYTGLFDFALKLVKKLSILYLQPINKFFLQETEINGLVDRIDFILGKCKDKRVLHLGCTDYPLLMDRDKDSLLHSKIGKLATNLVGIDNSEEGVEKLKKWGYDNVFCVDIISETNEQIKQEYDVIIAGELIEHIVNPGEFLTKLKKYMSDNTILIVTVPNSQFIGSFLATLNHTELCHPDHVIGYSFYTLRHLLEVTGYNVEELYGSARKKNLISVALSENNYFAEGLIAVCKKKV